MKRINLINSLSSHDHHAIARWFSLTLASMVLVSIVLSSIGLYQLVSLYSAKYAYESARKKWATGLTMLEKRNRIQDEIAQLQKKSGLASARLKNPLALLKTCTAESGIWIEHFRYDKGACEMQVSCGMNINERTLLAHISSQPGIKEAIIQSIQQKNDEKQLLTIKAVLH